MTSTSAQVRDDPGPHVRLTVDRLVAATHALATRDPDLGAILERHGPPPLWDREPGFATLVAIVLEQQVSLRSGAAALDRLRRAAGQVQPGPVLALGEAGARAAGLTRQKARYVVGLATAALDGRFDAERIAGSADDGFRADDLHIGAGPR